ncbi:DUF4233 domain-containing protein [Rathayibacter soli]|uniref:DUF4233 domain-containing protein n=1 Tax=Rathayibacter soli TaxID=3144168 RepID=UPI0027E48D7F|nr:DUF4233 domain-containing protein [Glaciibacter superstes]
MRPQRRSARQSLGQIVLGFEFVVVFLGALVAFGLKAVPPAIALGGGGALVVIMLATVGLLRYRWGFALGWALQVIVIASGFLVSMMFIVGAIFTGMWAYAMITGERLDRTNATPAAQAASAAADHAPTNDDSSKETENPE